MPFADFMRVMSQQVHAHDFRRDGEKVNIRGGIDRVLRDQVPKDLADRANWIRAAQTALSINGSGIRMNTSNEKILSCLQGEDFNNTAQMREFMVNTVFDYSLVVRSTFSGSVYS